MNQRIQMGTLGAGIVGCASVFIVLTIALLRSVVAGASGQPVEFETVYDFTMSDGRNPSCSYEKDIVNLSTASIDVVVPDGTAFGLAPAASERIRLLDVGQLLRLTNGETTPLTFMVDGEPVQDALSLASRCAPDPEQVKLPDSEANSETVEPELGAGDNSTLRETTTTTNAVPVSGSVPVADAPPPVDGAPVSAVADDSSVVPVEAGVPTSGHPARAPEQEPVGTSPDAVGPQPDAPERRQVASPVTTPVTPAVTAADPQAPVPGQTADRATPVAPQPTDSLTLEPDPVAVEGQIVRNSSGRLPFTGGNLVRGLTVSLVLVLAGTAMIVVARRHV